MRLKQIIKVDKYFIENNSKQIQLYFLGGSKVLYPPEIDSVDSKYLNLEVLQMSRVGKYYQIGLATPKEGEEANSLVTIEDLVRKVGSEVIFYYEDYKSFFETNPETKEIYRGSVEEALNCPKEGVKEFLNFSCEFVEIGSTYLVGSIYTVFYVKRIKE